MSAITLGNDGQSPGSDRATRRWARLLRLLTGNQALGWVDQIAVSAMAFVTLVLIGAWTNIGELGVYAVCMSVLALALASQESLVTRPYTIHMQDSRDPAGHAFGALALSLILGIGLALLLAVTAGALTLKGGSPQAASAAWALAGSVPFVLLRDFARRLAFAQMQTAQALVLDVAVVAVNAVLLAGLAWSGYLSAQTAVGSVGLSCAVGAAAWLWLARGSFVFGMQHLRTTLRRSWGIGKWLFSAQMAMQVQGYTTHWLSLVLAGAAATGAYAACTSIVSFANPLLFGFFNIMIPKSARVFSSSGSSGLRRQTLQDSLLLAALMSVFCVFLAIFGETAMTLLFPEASGYGTVLILLGLAALAAAVGVPASTALASANRAHAVAGVTAVAAAVNFGLVWWLLGAYGLTGAAVGILVAEVLGSVGRWSAFLMLVPAPAKQVEQHMSARQP